MFESENAQKCVRQDCNNGGLLCLGGLCCECKAKDTAFFDALENPKPPEPIVAIAEVVKQSRSNSGKPRLTYFYSSSRALRKLDSVQIPAGAGIGYVSGALAAYLGREEDMGLALAAAALLLFMSVELEDADAAIAAYCDVCEYGEKKYSRGDYRKGDTICNYIDSGLRHLRAYQRGEVLDPESGCLHVAHCLWNLIQALDQPDWRDDRMAAVYDHPVAAEGP